MVYSRPPRGYRSQEHPLPHNFEYQFDLDVEDETKNSTICTLFRSSRAAFGVEAVEVNPTHNNFAEETGATIFQGSIIPKISVNMVAWMNLDAYELDSVENFMFKWMPIYTSFLNTLDAKNAGTPASDIETILELQHDTANQDTYPLFAGTKLAGGNHPLSTVTDSNEALGDVGLTTTAVMESVAFDEPAFWDAKHYYTNAGMLNKVSGRMNTIHLNYRRQPYKYFSNNFTQPMVKRGNPYTFCGILFHMPQADSFLQYCDSTDINTSVAHIHIGMQVSYDEWNPDFDQTSV